MDNLLERLPSGEVTFVVTDIEGSSALLMQHTDIYPRLLHEHRDLLRRSWAQVGGVEVDTKGDGTMAVFGSADAAVEGSLRAQRALADHRWPNELRPLVRMGIHTGLARPIEGQYISIAVHRATRVAEAAHGDQVLASETTAAQVDPASLRPLGRFRMRDFDTPLALHQVGPGTFPPPRCMPAGKHNLPTWTTPLRDRRSDIERVRSLLGESRLISVIGVGGCGKTRLVGEFALADADAWPDGIWTVACERVEDPALLAVTVARAIGLPLTSRATSSGDPTEELCAELADRSMVLILDGCHRHRAEVAALLTAILGHCPGVRVLVTGTEPLHIAGELVYRPAPLGVSRSGPDLPDAVQLFLDRARTVRPDLTVDAETLRVISLICRRLDGLPLALEIAAARIGALHPAQILEALDHGIRLISVADPTRPVRQRGLPALLDWNIGLLEEPERLALERFSLFASSFDPAAAMAVAQDTLDTDGSTTDPTATLDVLWSLVDKSLLVADTSAGGNRYRMLETVRSFTRQRLVDRGDAALCAEQLADHYLRALRPEQGTGLTWLHTAALELDNVRGVLPRLPAERAETGQTLAVLIARHHLALQTLRTGATEILGLAQRWLQPTPARVGLLCALGDLQVRTGDVEAARATVVMARELRAEVGAPAWDEVGVEKLDGELALALHRPEVAARIAEQALTGELSARGRARMWNMLGIARATMDDLNGARLAFRGELDAAAAQGDDVLLAHAHSNAAEIGLRTHDLASAAAHQRTCLEIAMTLGQTGMLAYGLLATARIMVDDPASEHADWPLAVSLTAKAETMLDETGLTLYSTDRRLVEEFLLQARERLGPDRYHHEVLEGRAAKTEAATAAALAVIDLVAPTTGAGTTAAGSTSVGTNDSVRAVPAPKAQSHNDSESCTESGSAPTDSNERSLP